MIIICQGAGSKIPVVKYGILDKLPDIMILVKAYKLASPMY